MSDELTPYDHLMAIALIQDGLDRLDPVTAQEMSTHDTADSSWQQQIIRKINGSDLPVAFIYGVLIKKWEKDPKKDIRIFTTRTLKQWGILHEQVPSAVPTGMS